MCGKGTCYENKSSGGSFQYLKVHRKLKLRRKTLKIFPSNWVLLILILFKFKMVSFTFALASLAASASAAIAR